MAAIDPFTAGGVFLATAATDAVYVMFTSAVVARKRVPAATWSSVWYVLSSYAVISYTENWLYVAFAAAGSADASRLATASNFAAAGDSARFGLRADISRFIMAQQRRGARRGGAGGAPTGVSASR